MSPSDKAALILVAIIAFSISACVIVGMLTGVIK